MAHTLKANIYLFIMGVTMYVLSLLAQGPQAHQWATLLQQGTYVCLGAIGFLFVARVVIIVMQQANRTVREGYIRPRPVKNIRSVRSGIVR